MKIGFCGLLTIILILLKVFKVIACSWIWVFSPIWIPVVACVSVMIGCFILALIFN